MLEALNQFALESLADSFETMAFMSPNLAEEPYEPPTNAVLLSLKFANGSCGTVEMVASRNLGKVAASNMLGDDLQSPAQHDDALKELLNIFGGLMLRRWTSQSRETIRMSLPQMREFDTLAEWSAFIASPGTTVLNVEGNVVAMRVRSCG
ncbi:MAG TPA: hypothetical protein VHS31_03360 [Tepidisphaeraceae bacterium]|jgi:chemotaxis protein CheY-P-specific phosphatase CheC|nr:hypothetical protein [Tepidisphaeraceae bacterium]